MKGEKSKITVIALFTTILASTLIPTLVLSTPGPILRARARFLPEETESIVLPLRENTTVSLDIRNIGDEDALGVTATITDPSVVKLYDNRTINVGVLKPGETKSVKWKMKGVLIGNGTITVKVKGSNVDIPVVRELKISVVSDIKILGFEAIPTVVFTPISNHSIVNATIKNIAPNLVTHDVTLELVLPSGLTSAQSLTRSLGDLDPYNVTIVTWDVTVEEVGAYELTLKILTTDAPPPHPYPTAKTLLLAIIEEMIVYDNAHDPHVAYSPPYYEAASFVQLMREYGTVFISNSTLTPELLGVTKLLVIPSPDPAATHTTEEIQAIKDYVKNGGALFIMGTYYAYFDPSFYDPITSEYGIRWVDGSMRDKNDHDPVYGYEYFVLLDTFPDSEVANTLKLGVENIKLSGTCLNITDMVNVYPIVTGDDDPGGDNTVTRDNGNILHEFNGTKTIPLAAVELTGGGKIVACGSDFIIRVGYEFFDHNEQFLRNLLSYLLAVPPTPKVKLTLEVPSSAYVDKDFTISVVVKSTGTANATDVQASISLPTGLALVNESATFPVGFLRIGQEARLVYVVKASEVGSYRVTVTVSGTDFEDVTKTSFETSVSEKPGIPLVTYVAIAVVVVVVIVAVAYLIIRRRPSV